MTPKEASDRYHWVKYDPDTNTVDLFMDHYMLSCLRTCEAKFHLEHLLKLKPRRTPILLAEGTTKVIRKPWFCDFGEYIHWCLEQFYNHFKINKQAPSIDWWLDQCKIKWEQMKMDEYKKSIVEADVTKLAEVGGWTGVCGLLAQYYVFYMNMRLRVIDTEITFGHNKEVNLGDFAFHIGHKSSGAFNTVINCYLTGRIDLLVDNGYKIGPVDHKTTHRFDGFEHRDFNPHDGITGYIYAIHELLRFYKEKHPVGSEFPGLRESPQCLGGWIFHISACTPAMPNKESRAKGKIQGPRFKATPVDKTIIQLEDFKNRQLSTFKRVAELLFNDKVPEWNTTTCHNMFFRECEYVPIHEQPSDQWVHIIDQHYETGSGWDTREHSNKEKENTNKIG